MRKCVFIVNLLTKIKQLGHGAVAITEWLGGGAEVVDNSTAQARADICLKCPKHDPNQSSLVLLAKGVRGVLSVKNDIGLTVNNEDKLGTCTVCGCVLKLQVFEPEVLLKREESEKYPNHCWKP